uniref:Uncharacterized protein n=1 Tax=Trichuris muris TaxID=70415 RepID=A0A5S6QHZ8_TRIMR
MAFLLPSHREYNNQSAADKAFHSVDAVLSVHCFAADPHPAWPRASALHVTFKNLPNTTSVGNEFQSEKWNAWVAFTVEEKLRPNWTTEPNFQRQG